MFLWQSDKTPVKQRAWLSIGDHSYPLLGGVAVIFDGAQILHGVWAPKQAHDSARYPWYGCAFVQKKSFLSQAS